MEQTESIIRKEGLISALTSGAINGTITWFTAFGQAQQIPLTLNEIRTEEQAVSVFGQGVVLALFLSLILSSIAFKTFGGKARKLGLAPAERLDRPFFGWGLRVAASHAFAAFGLAVVLAILWQWAVGTVYVSNVAGTLIVALIACAVAFYANVTMMRALVRP